MLILISFLSISSYSQNDNIGQQRNLSRPSFVFLPEGLQFAPLKANIHEPHLGIFKFIDDSGMKVDLGNSIDLFQYRTENYGLCFRAGIDFFAFAFVKSTEGLRLQIDALDGFFGGNISAVKQFEDDALLARLRILHQSAHLVDGHYKNGGWMDNRQPIPFTRDLGELILMYKMSSGSEQMQYYGGISYATLIRPSEIKRVAALAGVEFSTSRIVHALFNEPVNLFAAYNLSSSGSPKYTASHQIQTGLKFGERHEKGINFYLAYYSGRHMFAEYFDQNLRTLGAGFSVDFF